MKTIFKTLALIFMMHAIAMSTNAQDPQKPMMTPYGIGYLEYLPADYATSGQQYPAIIFLHGSGERGTGTPADLAKVTANGPPKHIKNGHKMCFTVNGKTECFIVLSPQTIKWSWKYDVVPFVKHALATYRIDPTRVYLTGLSMGGEGTWFGASLEDNVPNLFAAIVPMCGRAAVSDGTNVANKKIPVWGFHGDADTAIPLAAGQRPITGMTTAKAVPAPIFTIYAGGSHATAWDRGYRTDHSYHATNVYEWFLSQRLATSAPQPPPPANTAPVVNAGVDQNVTLPVSQISITAAASDTDGTIASYAWTKTSGPAATLSNTSSQTLGVTSLVAGTYSFTVTVTDNQNATASDQVTVVVNPSLTNQAPVVEAGEKQTITLPSHTATFTAVASDVDGTIASYTWKKIGGSATITMTGTNTSTLSVSNVVSGTYVFRVEVADNQGLKNADTVRLKVNAAVAGRMATAEITTNAAEITELSLGQNYPNPVVNATTIPFSVDTDQHVVIKLFNTTGIEVATLLNENVSTGQHEVQLNIDQLRQSKSAANTIYYYKLIVNGKIITRQLMIL